jgi:hypothetical protein
LTFEDFLSKCTLLPTRATGRRPCAALGRGAATFPRMSGHLLFTGFDFNPRGTNPPAKSSSASSLDVDAASGADTPLRPCNERRSLLEDLESSDEETKDGPAGSSHCDGVKADSDSVAACSPLRSNVKESLNAARNKGQLGSELWWSLPCEILVRIPVYSPLPPGPALDAAGPRG